MTAVPLDTCVFAGSLQAPGRLTPAARSAIADASAVYLSPISFFEITWKVRIGTWPDMAPLAPNLAALAHLQMVTMASLDAMACSAAGSTNWSHSEPFERMIAAIAIQIGCPPVSSDAAFDGVVSRIW